MKKNHHSCLSKIDQNWLVTFDSLNRKTLWIHFQQSVHWCLRSHRQQCSTDWRCLSSSHCCVLQKHTKEGSSVAVSERSFSCTTMCELRQLLHAWQHLIVKGSGSVAGDAGNLAVSDRHGATKLLPQPPMGPKTTHEDSSHLTECWANLEKIHFFLSTMSELQYRNKSYNSDVYLIPTREINQK